MKTLEKKHTLATRWFHWINFPVLMVMIWSGCLIYWANDVYTVRLGSHVLFHFSNKGPDDVAGLYLPAHFYDRLHIVNRLFEGMAWHFTFMWIFAINGLLYVLYTAVSGEWRTLLPARGTLRDAIHVVLHDLHLSRKPLRRAKFNGAQRLSYTGIILAGLGSLVTGVAIYKPTQFAWITSFLNHSVLGVSGYNAARFVHFWITIGFCMFFVVHVLQVMRAGWNNFRAMITGYEIVPPDPHEADSQLTEPDGQPAPAASA